VDRRRRRRRRRRRQCTHAARHMCSAHGTLCQPGGRGGSGGRICSDIGGWGSCHHAPGCAEVALGFVRGGQHLRGQGLRTAFGRRRRRRLRIITSTHRRRNDGRRQAMDAAAAAACRPSGHQAGRPRRPITRITQSVCCGSSSAQLASASSSLSPSLPARSTSPANTGRSPGRLVLPPRRSVRRLLVVNHPHHIPRAHSQPGLSVDRPRPVAGPPTYTASAHCLSCTWCRAAAWATDAPATASQSAPQPR
jgi:hypothetical protein